MNFCETEPSIGLVGGSTVSVRVNVAQRLVLAVDRPGDVANAPLVYDGDEIEQEGRPQSDLVRAKTRKPDTIRLRKSIPFLVRAADGVGHRDR